MILVGLRNFRGGGGFETPTPPRYATVCRWGLELRSLNYLQLNAVSSHSTHGVVNVGRLYFNFLHVLCGHAVAQLVEALHYKPEGRGYDSRWCHWNFSLTKSFRSHYGPGVDSACNRNEYQDHFLGVKLAGALGWHPCYLHVPIILKSGNP